MRYARLLPSLLPLLLQACATTYVPSRPDLPPLPPELAASAPLGSKDYSEQAQDYSQRVSTWLSKVKGWSTAVRRELSEASR